MKIWFKMLMSFLLVVSLSMCIAGIYKFSVYEKPEGYGDYHNVYVEGDAYNFIISAGQGTGFFVLSAGCLVASLLSGIWGTLDAIHRKNAPDSRQSSEIADAETSDKEEKEVKVIPKGSSYWD